ncbi:YgjV family protein [Halomonas sp. McH1-25]|uniref:YgjV family protein n=1 Tax=unclassified Halomonas TaxID=2609666 RepID=UPI001EF4ED79|nr:MULTISPECIES: YgjV family protein [unclassified Halomonas]MCG7601021.1 YgjV family protein [Halomonas sp. McH1-25]MCP1342112.1 YgjV family protein [Halomonas sp. FL8]MCP1360599.1 YgjV family protein [Halomonas sp. BBD45]MCP1367145.1 YgjV family protein [Halomonas sp. BBD48]
MLESYNVMAGQFFGLVSLVLCVLAFASKQDDRLMGLLISANVAFALQFIFFGSWTAAALTVLVIARIALARRYPGNKAIMSGVLAVSGVAVVLTWQSWVDLAATVAMVFGTVGMFMLRGISMRIFLGLAALAWMLSHALVGSVGGTLAEALVFLTNSITIYRLYRAKRRYPKALD